MRERTYRPVKLPLLIACTVLLALLAAAAVTALHAQRLLIKTLDGRLDKAVQAQVTQFALREQMIKAQTDTRVRGWLSIVQKEDVGIETARGVLRGSLFHPIGTGKDAPWAVVLHGGLGTDRNQVLDIACALSLEGYYVLTPDLYAHGASDGTLSSLGLADAQDVHAWCEWTSRREQTARIVLFGQDEGGFAALTAAAQGLPAQVCAVAADSVYAGVSERLLDLLYRQQGKESEWQSLLLHAAYYLAHGTDAEEGELIQKLSACDLPLLIIHGTGDADVPAWHGEDLAAAAKNAQLIFMEGAAHGMARYADSERYYEALHGFFRGVL